MQTSTKILIAGGVSVAAVIVVYLVHKKYSRPQPTRPPATPQNINKPVSQPTAALPYKLASTI